MILEPIRVLSADEMEKIHQTAMKILSEVGMKIESPKAIKYLKRIGCIVNENSFDVKFPTQIVQQYVDKMRADYRTPSRTPKRMSVRYSQINFTSQQHRIHPDFTASAGGFCCFIYDLMGNRRNAEMADVHRSINLVNHLDHINYTGLPVADQQTPIDIRTIKMAGELAKYTTKFGGVETFDKREIPYLIDIATIIKGSLDALKKEPILIGYGEARSPLCLDRNMVEIFMEYIERGFPQTLDTMPNGGATAPVTAAGLLALGIAETLGAVVLAYSIDENAVVGVDIIPSYCDMTTGLFRYATAERMPLLVARVQMISEYYGCPSGVHGGKTDSCFVNVQCGIQKAFSTVFPVLAGAIGIGTVGHIENAVTFSPQQLVIDNEIFSYMHKTLQPIKVNEETLAFDTIKKVGIGGNYMGQTHTAEHFKNEMFFSQLFETMPWATAHGRQTKGMENRAHEMAMRIWDQIPQPVVDSDKIRAIDDVVKHAHQEFQK